MSIRHEDTQQVNISGTLFNWSAIYRGEYIVFIAENENMMCRKIEVHITNENQSIIIQPNSAQLIISEAIKHGWNPNIESDLVVFDWIGNTLVKRIGL